MLSLSGSSQGADLHCIRCIQGSLNANLLGPAAVTIYSLYLPGLAAGLGDGVHLLHALGLRGHDAGLSLLRGARRLRERHAHLT